MTWSSSVSLLKVYNAFLICDVYDQNHDILFNHDTTVCMYIPSGNCYYLNTPVVVLNADDANMRRQRGIHAMLVPMAL